jgi:replicative DNA helicase
METKELKLDCDFFEHVIVYTAFKSEAYLSMVSDVLNPKFIKNQDNKNMYALLYTFFNKFKRQPTLSELKSYCSSDMLKRSLKEVELNFQTVAKIEIDDIVLLEQTQQFVKERAMYQLLEDIAESNIRSGIPFDVTEILKKVEKISNVDFTVNIGMDYFKDIEKFVHGLKEDESFLSTGYPWLDRKIGGGYMAFGRAMYVFSGAPNSGKSILLGNAAVNILAQGKNVLIITLEMSEKVYASRITSQLLKFPNSKLKENGDKIVEAARNYHNINKNSQLIIKEFPTKGVTVAGIKVYITTLIRKYGFKPDAIIIDYLNLIQASINTGDSYSDVKGIAEDVRGLSYIFECPIITATQLGRSAINKDNPGMETVSESLGTVMTADVGISVFSSEEDREMGIINLGMQRNRYGPNFGTKAMSIDWDTLYVVQTNDDDNDDGEESGNFTNDTDSLIGAFAIE